jgi:hypothetical protein
MLARWRLEQRELPSTGSRLWYYGVSNKSEINVKSYFLKVTDK